MKGLASVFFLLLLLPAAPVLVACGSSVSADDPEIITPPPRGLIPTFSALPPLQAASLLAPDKAEALQLLADLEPVVQDQVTFLSNQNPALVTNNAMQFWDDKLAQARDALNRGDCTAAQHLLRALVCDVLEIARLLGTELDTAASDAFVNGVAPDIIAAFERAALPPAPAPAPSANPCEVKIQLKVHDGLQGRPVGGRLHLFNGPRSLELQAVGVEPGGTLAWEFANFNGEPGWVGGIGSNNAAGTCRVTHVRGKVAYVIQVTYTDPTGNQCTDQVEVFFDT